MVDIPIVNGLYKPTNIAVVAHPVKPGGDVHCINGLVFLGISLRRKPWVFTINYRIYRAVRHFSLKLIQT